MRITHQPFHVSKMKYTDDQHAILRISSYCRMHSGDETSDSSSGRSPEMKNVAPHPPPRRPVPPQQLPPPQVGHGRPCFHSLIRWWLAVSTKSQSSLDQHTRKSQKKSERQSRQWANITGVLEEISFVRIVMTLWRVEMQSGALSLISHSISVHWIFYWFPIFIICPSQQLHWLVTVQATYNDRSVHYLLSSIRCILTQLVSGSVQFLHRLTH